MPGDGGGDFVIAAGVRAACLRRPTDTELTGLVRSGWDIPSRRISRGGRRDTRGRVSGTGEVGGPGVAP